MTNPDVASSLHIQRSFGWGILLVMDQDAPAIPELSSSIVSANARGLLVKVHHAADVGLEEFAGDDAVPPAQVEVTVHVGKEAPADVMFSAFIEVPSGILTVGDPDHEERLEVEPGRWAARVAYFPPEDDADTVAVWLQRI